MYKCLQKAEYRKDDLIFSCLTPADIEPIRVWRNEQIAILRQNTLISPEEQTAYFSTEIFPSYQALEPKQILFSIKRGATLLGYGALTHIDWEKKSAEVSFLLDTRFQETEKPFQDLYRTFISFLFDLAFTELHFQKLTAEVYLFRQGMIALLEEAGFQKITHLKNHVFKRGKMWDAFVYEYPNICQNT